MKAAYIEKTGGPEVICYGEMPKPTPESNQVLIRVIATTVNHIDTYFRSGIYEGNFDFPHILGSNAVGVIEEVGSRVAPFKKGDRVWTCTQGLLGEQGTYAEYIVADHDRIYPLPENIDPIQAVAVLQSGMTATAGIILAAKLKTTDTIFVNGGSGAVGSALIQLSKARGAKVIASAGSEEKMEWCKSIGADIVFNYREEPVEKGVLKHVSHGVDVFWDTSRSVNLQTAVRVTGEQGRIVLMSGAKDLMSPLPVNEFYNKSLSLNGFTLKNLSPGELSQFSLIVNRCLQEKILVGKIAYELPLKEAAKAHQILVEHQDLWGKIVLTN